MHSLEEVTKMRPVNLPHLEQVAININEGLSRYCIAHNAHIQLKIFILHSLKGRVVHYKGEGCRAFKISIIMGYSV